MSEAVLCFTEQIKPQHIVGEDSLDNDDMPRKGEQTYGGFSIIRCLMVMKNYMYYYIVKWRTYQVFFCDNI